MNKVNLSHSHTPDSLYDRYYIAAFLNSKARPTLELEHKPDGRTRLKMFWQIQNSTIFPLTLIQHYYGGTIKPIGNNFLFSISSQYLLKLCRDIKDISIHKESLEIIMPALELKQNHASVSRQGYYLTVLDAYKKPTAPHKPIVPSEYLADYISGTFDNSFSARLTSTKTGRWHFSGKLSSPLMKTVILIKEGTQDNLSHDSLMAVLTYGATLSREFAQECSELYEWVLNAKCGVKPTSNLSLHALHKSKGLIDCGFCPQCRRFLQNRHQHYAS